MSITHFSKLLKAQTLLEAIVHHGVRNDTDRDAMIKRFEIVFELTWKMLKDHLFAVYGIETFGPRDTLTRAFETLVIDDQTLWLAMLKDRNLSTHTYDDELAQRLVEKIPLYSQAIQKLIARLDHKTKGLSS